MKHKSSKSTWLLTESNQVSDTALGVGVKQHSVLDDGYTDGRAIGLRSRGL